MAEVTILNSPVHSDCIITYPYGVVDYSYTCDFHTGLDFAPYGTTERNPRNLSCFSAVKLFKFQQRAVLVTWL